VEAVSVRNVTGKVQVMSNIQVTLMPGEWSDPIPWDTALWLKARGMVELDNEAVPLDKHTWIDDTGAYNLFWMSPFSVGDGYATAAENIVHCLRAHGVAITIRHLWFLVKEGLLPETMSMLGEPADVRHLVGLCMATPSEFAKLPTPYKIGLTMYEASDPLAARPEWLHDCNAVDALFVPTQFSKDVFSQFVTRPIRITPLAIDPIFTPREGELAARRAREKFRVISFGVLTTRKSPLETLDVFQKAFPLDKYPDVEMVFKTRTGFFGFDHNQVPEISDPRVTIVDHQRWSREQMREYINSADCSMILAKGEGFGMPARESMAMGVPTILSDNTGHQEVTNSQYNWPVPDARVEETRLGGTWSIPNWDYAVDVLRSIYDNREEASDRAAECAGWFAETWGADRVATDFKQAFASLGNPSTAVNHRRAFAQSTSTYLSYDEATLKELTRIHTPYVSAVARHGSGRRMALDVGVGNGVTANMLAQRGFRVVGIDKDPTVFEGCQRLFGGLTHPPVLAELDVLNLSAAFLNKHGIARERLVCTSQGMMEHHSDGDIRRILVTVLRFSEWFVFSVPSVYYPSRTAEDERLMRKEQWLNLLSEFNVVQCEYYGDNQHIYFAIQGADPPVRGTLVRYGRTVDSVWRPR